MCLSLPCAERSTLFPKIVTCEESLGNLYKFDMISGEKVRVRLLEHVRSLGRIRYLVYMYKCMSGRFHDSASLY